MAITSFDVYNQVEIPTFTLCNPDETVLYNLGTIFDRNLELRYNTLSTLTFTAPSQVDGVTTDYYDSLEYRRLVFVEGVANFMITDVKIDNNGGVEQKKITCQSMEVILSYKKLSLFSGTYTFNSVLSGSGVTTTNLMTELMSYIPGWTLVYVDPTLTNITRSFDVTDKTLYDFMINDVSQTFQCIFVFDTIAKTVRVKTADNATTPTDIFISFDNLMNSFTKDESTDELVTALNVLGGEDMAINLVNPIGTNTIYNFDYYKDTRWMSQSLIDALDVWEDKVDEEQPVYAGLLTGLRVENTNLITLESDLVTLEGELSALVVVKDARVQQGLDITEISGSIVVVEDEITAKEVEIATEEGVIAAINAQLSAINTSLLFENNFTASQLSSLNNFIIGSTYTNTTFIQTSLMSEVDVQNVSQELYDLAETVLVKLSQPRYSFDIDSANFLFIKDFEPFIAQTSLGCTITIELSPTVTTVAALLGIDFSYDDPTQFRLILSNRLRLDDSQFQYGDMQGEAIDAGITTKFNSQKWNSVSSSYNSVIGGGSNLVVSTTTSGSSNIAVFAGVAGTSIADVGAMYLAPTAFTPYLVSTDATFTYNYQVGSYAIIGRSLFFELSLFLSGVSGTTTNAVAIMMPVLHKNLTNLSSAFSITYENITLSAGYYSVCGLMAANSNVMNLYKEGTAVALAPIVASALGAATTKIYLTGQYLIN